MDLREFLSDYLGKYVAINDMGVVPDGEPNLDVIVWDTARNSRNDDGQLAIARESVYGEQPSVMSNGDVVLVDDDLLDDC